MDDVIDPRDTRPRLIDALRTLEGKRDRNPAKKHGNIPLLTFTRRSSSPTAAKSRFASSAPVTRTASKRSRSTATPTARVPMSARRTSRCTSAGAVAAESYLRIDRILEAARSSGAGAIHPGYGFLSERAPFAEQVEAAGLMFIGPPASAIRAMGDKTEARRRMQAAGVPVVPGATSAVSDAAAARAMARSSGYPVLVKAAAGGGGRGMRVVQQEADLAGALDSAAAEAAKAFGDPSVYLEKYIVRPRHVEIQVLADHERTIHLGERECSIQRRHQKVVEEAPSVAVSPDAARADGAGRGGRGAGGRLSRRRHLRVPARRRWLLLLPGDEHPDPGGASGHRAGVRRGPGAEQLRIARGAPHDRASRRALAARLGDRVPHHQRGSRAGFPPVDRAHRVPARALGPGVRWDSRLRDR